MIWKPHATVATVIRENGRYLLVEEAIGTRQLLNQPAGHLEPDESLAHAAVRETYEETGYRVVITQLIGIYLWKSPASGKQFMRTTFAARVQEHDRTATLDRGISATLWLTRAEIEAAQPRLRSPMVLRNVIDFESGPLYPTALIRDLRSDA